MFAQAGFFKRHLLAAGTRLEWPREDLYSAALDVLTNGGLVVLLGKRGTGKTQMSACLAAACAATRAMRPLYVRLADYFGSLKRSFDEGGDPRRQYQSVPFLVLDECQERYETAFEDLELTRLVDARYGNQLATVLIANLKPDEIAASLGPSIASRIQEVGAVIECKWPSFRESKMRAAMGGAA